MKNIIIVIAIIVIAGAIGVFFYQKSNSVVNNSTQKAMIELKRDESKTVNGITITNRSVSPVTAIAINGTETVTGYVAWFGLSEGSSSPDLLSIKVSTNPDESKLIWNGHTITLLNADTKTETVTVEIK